MSDPAMRPNHALDALTPALPWVWFLPAKDQAAFVRELVDINSPMPVADWRDTAQVYADPELLEAPRGS